MNNSARRAALLALMEFRRRSDAGADKPLQRQTEGLPLREKALATQLVYGVLQNYRKLDACIGLLCERKLQPQTRDILRLGLYQLLFLDRIPESAAVNESVALAKYLKLNKGAQSLINAVLRNAAKWDDVPVFEDIGVEFSHPDWLVELYTQELGRERAVELMKFNNTAPPAYLQQLKNDDGKLSIGDCVTHKGPIEDLPGYSDGAFVVADNAARLAVEFAAPQKNERVLDACAAPGGKSIMLYYAAQGAIDLVCCDKYPIKIVELKETLAKYGMDGVECKIGDAREFNPEFESAFDLVLADVPCSCLGIIRKKPDIRFKEPDFGEPLAGIQRRIINNLARYVAPNGRLVYVTCTVVKRENQDVISDFLSENPKFTLEDMFMTPFAAQDIDGFFYAKLKN
jgi:16S rRNA (cytosine967-C5)-methyltransferase